MKKKLALLLSVIMVLSLVAAVIPTATRVYAQEGAEDGAGEFTDQPSEDEKEPEKLSFTKKYSKIKAGKSKTFKVNLSGAKWKSSDTAKATVSSTGKVKAKVYGKVTITATVGSQKVSAKVTIQPKKVIGIDAGHQLRADGSTEPIGPGASTRKPKVAGGTRGVSTGKPEYVLTLEVAKKLKKKLVKKGYKVVMTRTRHDVNISNKERAQKLNKSCDIAVRIHGDGGGSSARGASMLYPSASNPYVGKLSKKSLKLSKCIIEKYSASTGIRSRGCVARDDLTGTNWSTIPVTLIELGFMTNASEDQYMASSAGQKKMVNGIAKGIDAYFGY